MPVFHQFESFDWLDRMATETGYVGISASNDRGVQQREKQFWLQRVFERVGLRVRTHAFGLTSSQLLNAYPFYSADSTTWMSGIKYRSMVLFGGRKLSVAQLGPKKIARNLGNPNLRTDRHLVPFLKGAEYRMRLGVRAFLEFQEQCTDLWKARGIRWQVPFGSAAVGGAAAVLDPEKVLAARQPSIDRADASSVRRALLVESDRNLNRLATNLWKLKGAKLAVWVAYCLRADGSGRAKMNLGELEDLTGYSEDTIAAAKSWLRRNHWLVRERRGERGFTRLTDTRRGESGGEPDWHRARIP